MKNNKQTKYCSKPRNTNRKQVSTPSTSSSQERDDFIESDASEIQRINEYLSSLPPGCKFEPTDFETVYYYLRRKIANKPLPPVPIISVNLYTHHPRTMAEKYKHPGGNGVFYFAKRYRKYPNGKRPDRGVGDGIGWWKASAGDVKIMTGKEVIGLKKTLVFHEGKPRSGTKTNWIMHEYRFPETKQKTSMKLDEWVLCKIRDNSKNENNKEANTNISDAKTENAPTYAIAADEEVKRLNTGYCGTSDHNQFTGYGGEANRRNTGSGTSFRENENNEEANTNRTDAETENSRTDAIVVDEEDKHLNTGHCGTSSHNQFTDYGEQGSCGNTGFGISYYDEEANRRNTGCGISKANLLNTGCGTSYYDEEANRGNTGYGISEDNLQKTGCGISEEILLNTGYCGTSYNNLLPQANDVYQSQQDMGPLSPRSFPFQFDSCQDMGLYNAFQFETPIMCDNGFGIWYNFQGSGSNANDENTYRVTEG